MDSLSYIKGLFLNLMKLFFQKIRFLVFSQKLIKEFLEVANRPKFRQFFSSQHIEEILETIHEYADFLKVHTKVEVCRDFKNNFLLSLSIDGDANYLLTDDKDLLELEKFGEMNIITFSSFWRVDSTNVQH